MWTTLYVILYVLYSSSYLTPATLRKVSTFRLSTETLGRVRPRGAMYSVTLFVSGKGALGALDGGEEDAEDARDEVDSGSDDERGVVEPGLTTVPPAATENMAWVPLARISCVSCRRFMSPSREFSSVSVMLPRSRSCTQHSSVTL